ncbi:hypothetical protein SPFM15_00184 [Salmonella phage SPFM15]|nr:hypothetical protein SPFM5_00179 [Salmonella phage SPFM5]VFR13808.1 hypothetical protein SPFM15_00184 [Salmonella phage SPFM15]
MGRLTLAVPSEYAADIKLPTVPEWTDTPNQAARMQHYLACRGFTPTPQEGQAVLALMRKTHLVINVGGIARDWLMSIISKHPRTSTKQVVGEGEGVVDLREASCRAISEVRRKRRRAPYRFYPNTNMRRPVEGCSVKHAQMILGRHGFKRRYQIGKVLEIACLVLITVANINKNGNLPEYVDISVVAGF